MLQSLRNSELSNPVSNNKTYKSHQRSHVDKSTALLDKSNAQILQERKIEKIPDSVRKRKLHKARKLFVHSKTEKNQSDEHEHSITENKEFDELDLILMDIHKANVDNCIITVLGNSSSWTQYCL